MSLPPIECKFITAECLREWKNGNTNFKLPNSLPMLRFLYELCWTMVWGDLPFQKCKLALDSVEISDKTSNEEMSSVFADIVTQMSQDLTMSGENRARLITMVHWKWSCRITRLLIQCLESNEYMEIRNALIMLTKISSVFPVTRKSRINLENRVARIKGDEREDLKVLATGVAAALASRKSSWVTDEEFCIGYVDLKPPTVPASKSLGVIVPNGSSLKASQMESAGMKNSTIAGQLNDSGNLNKDSTSRARSIDGRLDRTESVTLSKYDLEQPKLKDGSLANGLEIQCISTVAVPSGLVRSADTQKHTDDKGQGDENLAQVAQKTVDSEVKTSIRRSVGAGSLTKQSRHDGNKDENKYVKPVTRHASPLVTSSSDRDLPAHPADGWQSTPSSTGTTNGNTVPGSSKVLKAEGATARSSESRVSVGKEIDDVEAFKTAHLLSFPEDSLTASNSMDTQQKRATPSEELDRLSKRRKDSNVRDGDVEVRFSDRKRSMDARFPHADVDKTGIYDHALSRATEKLLDRSKEKGSERYDRDHGERLERPDKSVGDEVLSEGPRDRSLERYGRERSIERVLDRNFDRIEKLKDDRYKDERSKLRYSESPLEKSHLDDRFNRQSLPPPPPLPSHMVPQSISGSRRDEDADRRVSNTRHMQRLSPRHEEKDRRRFEEISLASQDDAKRRRDEDFRERKRDERDGSAIKVEEREKVNISKDDLDTNAASKRRKLKRDHLSSSDVSEYPMGVLPLSPPSVSLSQSFYDGRERPERKVSANPRAGFGEEPSARMHNKEAANKITRHSDQLYDRELDEEKRLRAEQKRRHRK